MNLDFRRPSLRDPRLVQAAILLGYSIAAREIYHLERDHVALLVCLLWAVFLDLALGALVWRHVILPLSAVIIALSSSIIVDLTDWRLYLLVVTLGVCSKSFVRYRRMHIFNPTNFAVVVSLQLMPRYAAAVPTLFAGYLWPSVVFAALGVFTTIWAGQAVTSFTWIGMFAVLAWVRSLITGAKLALVLAPILSTSFLLFTFHMITDPATTPRTTRWRIVFATGVALLDAAIRFSRIPFGQFYALFLVSCFLPWIRDFEAGK